MCKCDSQGGELSVEEPRDDDVLPDGLEDSLIKAANATDLALQDGNARVIADVFIPELFDPLGGPMMANEGDQKRYWDMSKTFSQKLAENTGGNVRVVYPDAGVAAMLSSQWVDANFRFSSLNDRNPFAEDDNVIVIACADPQGVDKVIEMARKTEGTTPLVLFNARLASGEVGVGLSARRLRNEFLSSFVVAYALRPFQGGTVFRLYNEMWKVFIADANESGRFVLLSEMPRRPSGEELENLILDYLGEGDSGDDDEDDGNVLAGAAKFVKNLTRFISDISKPIS